MNRRTLLKGAAATSSLMLTRNIQLQGSLGQGPMLTAEVIYEFTNFLGEKFDMIADGRVASANSAGLIVGRDVIDGKTVPCTWDTTGARRLLDTGDTAFAITGFTMPVSQNGLVAASLYAEPDLSSRMFSISWALGAPKIVPSPDPTASVLVMSINDAGVMAGTIGGVATRWTGDEIEQLPLENGATSSWISKLNEAGDGYGCSANEGAIIDVFVWKADGTVEPLPLPDELTTGPAVTIGNISYPTLFADGGYVLVAYAKDGEMEIGGSWVMDGGAFTKLPSSNAETQGIVSIAVSPTQLFGRVVGVGESTGPAAWVDGALYLLRDLVVLPNGGNLSSIHAVLEDGTLVASTIPIGGQTTPASIVLLHPA